MIPKLIHQTAKTPDIPEKWRTYQSKVKALHPDWTYKLWTDADNIAFVKSEFPDFLDVYTRLPKNIMRADVIRYLILYKLGGLYLDLDYEMFKPFDLTQHEAILPWESEGEFGAGNDKLCNAFLAAAPGHPFFKRLLEELKAHPPLNPDADVESSTGPIFISRIFRETAQNLNIFTPRASYSVLPPRTTAEYKAIVNRGTSYGVHHCTGSWRTYSWPVLMRIHIGQTFRRMLGEKRVESAIQKHPFLMSFMGIRR